MTRTLLIVGIIVIAIVAGVGIYYVLQPNHAGDATKVERTFTAAEQELIDQVQISAEELAQHDGRQGRPGWVAVNGVVYDVSDKWTDGTHHGLAAGQDQTASFIASGHARATLQSLGVIGGYSG